MIKICCYCTPHHRLGPDDGSGIMTHGLCTKAYIKETAKPYWKVWKAGILAIASVSAIVAFVLGIAYFAAHLFVWGYFRGFKVVGF